MRYVASVRREIKIRTFFNILGPLVNPANASMQIMGVFEPELVDIMAYAMVHLGVKNGMVIHGLDGLDEATVTDETMVCEIRNGNMMSYKINPSLLGLGTYSLGELKSADIEENVQLDNVILDKGVVVRRDRRLLGTPNFPVVIRKNAVV